MQVVNVKVAHIALLRNTQHKCISPRYNNLKEWMLDENNVYIGRRGIVFVDGVRYPPRDSTWANPYKVNKNNLREDVVAKYRRYILDRLATENGLLDELLKLQTKTLGCWCKPERCHGDVLVDIVEYYNKYGVLPVN